MILYINACPRTDSRTDKIAKAYLKKIGKPYKELKLTELNLQPLNNNSLEKRTNLLVNNMYDDEMFKYSNEFSNASNIVIAAPFWDYSFPSILKGVNFKSTLVPCVSNFISTVFSFDSTDLIISS